MYERSIKTINNFRILPEAEYWMERELKIKLGWDDSREIASISISWSEGGSPEYTGLFFLLLLSCIDIITGMLRMKCVFFVFSNNG